MSINLLIVEDDISLLTELRMELDELNLNIHAESTEAGVRAYLAKTRPDLIVMDLYLHGSNSGHELSGLINNLGIPFIVMTQHSIDFIYREVLKWRPQAFYSKPIDYLSLKYFIEKFVHAFNGQDEKSETRTNGLYVKKRTSIIWLNYSDLLVVKGEGNYVSLSTSDDKFVLRNSLVKFMEDLPEKWFIRVHRNYIVNLQEIQRVDFQKCILFIADTEIPIGRTYKSKLKNIILV